MKSLYIEAFLRLHHRGDEVVKTSPGYGWAEARNSLLEAGLIDDNCRVTSRGRAFVEHLHKLDLPVAKREVVEWE